MRSKLNGTNNLQQATRCSIQHIGIKNWGSEPRVCHFHVEHIFNCNAPIGCERRNTHATRK